MTEADLKQGQLYRWKWRRGSPVLLRTDLYEGLGAVVVVPSDDGYWALGELVLDCGASEEVELEE